MEDVKLSAAAAEFVSLSKTTQEEIYVLRMHNGEDNRLTTGLCQAVLTAMDLIERRCPVGTAGALIVTGAHPKFFSNGLDLNHAFETPGFWDKSFYAMLRRVLSFHLPCLAAINGHAFAGGAMFAMCFDYRFSNSRRGYICLNEIDFGAPLQPGMLACVQSRLTPSALRKCVLEGHRFTGPEQLEAGFVEATVDPSEEGVLKAAMVQARKVMSKAASGAFGKLKIGINVDILDKLTIAAKDAMDQRLDDYDAERLAMRSPAKL
ncbi:hypothetical protein PYCC9005_005249 [Savitreella phatthalungensis]